MVTTTVNINDKVIINGRNIRYTGEISTPNPNEYEMQKDKGGSGDCMIIPGDTTGEKWSIGGIFPEDMDYLLRLKEEHQDNLGQTATLVIGDFNNGHIISADIIITDIGSKGNQSSDLEFTAMNIRRDYNDVEL